MMKRRAKEGAYLLAFFGKDYTKNKECYFEEIVDMIVKVTDTEKAEFIKNYQRYLDFSHGKIEWHELKSQLRTVLAYFMKFNDDEKYQYSEDYFRQIKNEYKQIINRNEEHLLYGRKFARIYDFELNENEEVMLHMSIVTKNIMEYDSIMFNNNEVNNHKKNHYKPYFIEFSSEYIDLNYFKSLDLNTETKDDKWIAIEFLEDDKITDNKCLTGTFIFSASPLKIYKKRIEIIDVEIPEEVKNFNKSYLDKVKKYMFDNTKKGYLNKELDKIFPNSYKECEVTIFNVGQGSLNLIEMDGKKFIFDIGDSKYKGEDIEIKNKEKADKLIKTINPDCVILSHWDLDHILGIAKMTDKIFESYWIVPDIVSEKGFSDSAKRLMCFLAWYNKTKLISVCSECDNMNNTIIFSNDVFELGKGAGDTYNSKYSYLLKRDMNSLNFQNNFGLLLKVKGKKEHAIFSGDCDYDSFPKGFMKEYPEYLIVPHHGSKMYFDKMYFYKDNYRSKAKLAFISSGKNYYKCKSSSDCYSHPHICHMNFLEMLGYSVYQTALTSYYTFKL